MESEDPLMGSVVQLLSCPATRQQRPLSSDDLQGAFADCIDRSHFRQQFINFEFEFSLTMAILREYDIPSHVIVVIGESSCGPCAAKRFRSDIRFGRRNLPSTQ
jgi:hypothetical protein